MRINTFYLVTYPLPGSSKEGPGLEDVYQKTDAINFSKKLNSGLHWSEVHGLYDNSRQAKAEAFILLKGYAKGKRLNFNKETNGYSFK
jgi:hypothetical protein